MNTLEKKLVGIGKSTSEASEALVSEVKLLLESTASQERQVLRSIGLSAELNFAEAEQENLQIIKLGKENLGKEIITSSDIRKFCLEYRLYIKKAKEYMGTIPATLGAELLRFCEEKKIPVPAHHDHSNFYIIAPPKMFRGYKNPLQVLEIANNERKEAIRKREEDPILVYKLQNGYFAIIKSWGDDFTWLRKIYGFFTRRKNVERINIWINTIIFFGMLFFIYKVNSYVMGWDYHQSHLTNNSYFPWRSILSIVGSIVFFGFGMNYLCNSDYIQMRRSIISTITKEEQESRYL